MCCEGCTHALGFSAPAKRQLVLAIDGQASRNRCAVRMHVDIKAMFIYDCVLLVLFRVECVPCLQEPSACFGYFSKLCGKCESSNLHCLGGISGFDDSVGCGKRLPSKVLRHHCPSCIRRITGCAADLCMYACILLNVSLVALSSHGPLAFSKIRN